MSFSRRFSPGLCARKTSSSEPTRSPTVVNGMNGLSFSTTIKKGQIAIGLGVPSELGGLVAPSVAGRSGGLGAVDCGERGIEVSSH